MLNVAEFVAEEGGKGFGLARRSGGDEITPFGAALDANVNPNWQFGEISKRYTNTHASDGVDEDGRSHWKLGFDGGATCHVSRSRGNIAGTRLEFAPSRVQRKRAAMAREHSGRSHDGGIAICCSTMNGMPLLVVTAKTAKAFPSPS